MSTLPPVLVACLPRIADNPYQALLNGALEELGVEFDPVAPPTLRWALRSGGRLDALHLHWLESIVGSDAGPKVALRAARLLLVLLILKAREVRIVWTVHNLRPHDSRHPRRDLLLARGLARLSDELCASSKHAAAQIETAYRHSPVRVAYHPAYGLDSYPRSAASRAEIRAGYGIPADARVFLAFGLVRAYKRLPELVSAFRSVDDPEARLLIVGRPSPPGAEADIEARAAGDERVITRFEYVPDEAVGDLHAAADVAVLPYRDVFSSGALLLALGHGLPVVAPVGTTADEIADPPVVHPYADGELTRALAGVPPIDDEVGDAALAVSRTFTWRRCAEVVLAAYRGGDPL